MNDYRIIPNQGSPYIIEAENPDHALEVFDSIRSQYGLDYLADFKVLDVELVELERPVRILNGVKVT